MKQKILHNNWHRQFKRWGVNNIIRKQKENRIVMALLFCALCMIRPFSYGVNAEEMEEKTNAGGQISKTNVMLLFDKSGSMREIPRNAEQSSEGGKGYGQIAIEWAQDICSIIADSDIIFSAQAFDVACDMIAGPQVIKTSKVKENDVFKWFSDIIFSGNTNQYEAILKAEEQLKKETGRKYIIMLSDGELDLDNNEDDDTPEEITAKCNFREKCVELAVKEDYTIILIGLGQSIELYNGLSEISSNIKCYDNQLDLDDLKALLLNEVGFEVKSADIEDNTFFVDDNYDRCVIRVEYMNKSGLENGDNKNISEEDYMLYYSPEGKKREQLAVDRKIMMPTAIYLYLYNPQPGKYEVDFTDGTIQVDCIRQNRIGKVKLALLDENGNEYRGIEKNGCIWYDLEEEYKGKDDSSRRERITISVNSDIDRPTGVTAKFYWTESEDLEKEGDWDIIDENKSKQLEHFDFSANTWRESLDFESGKSYKCFVTIDTKSQGVCKSNIIFFTVPEVPISVSRYELYGKVDKVFLKEEYTHFDYLAVSGEVSVVWEGKVLMRNWKEETKVEEIQVNEKSGLCFKKEGKYIIFIKEDGADKEEVVFYIEKRISYKIILIIVIIAVIIIIVVWKKQKKRT